MVNPLSESTGSILFSNSGSVVDLLKCFAQAKSCISGDADAGNLEFSMGKQKEENGPHHDATFTKLHSLLTWRNGRNCPKGKKLPNFGRGENSLEIIVKWLCFKHCGSVSKQLIVQICMYICIIYRIILHVHNRHCDMRFHASSDSSCGKDLAIFKKPCPWLIFRRKKALNSHLT